MVGYYQLGFGFPSFGIDEGIILTSGSVSGTMGPNNSGSLTTPTSFNPSYFDSCLQSLVPTKTVTEAAVIEFDFTPITDTIIACKFVFGSEEYPEFVNTSFNDVFGFFITGPMPQGGWFQSQNLALIPFTNTPICIDNVNHLVNTQYYITNIPNGQPLQYDGYTVPLTLSQVVTPGQTYHFKVGVADCGDAAFDSGVFLKIKSFYGYASMPIANFNSTISGNAVTFDNTTNWAKFYVWHFGDGTTDTVYTNNTSISHFYANDGRYDVVLEAHNYYQIDTIIQNIQIGSTVGINNAKGNTFELLSANTDNAYQLNISLNHTQNVNITITNISGQKVKEILINNQKEISQLIDLNEFSRGIYVIKVNTAENSFVKKVINR
jgi:PKD repeat protein